MVMRFIAKATLIEGWGGGGTLCQLSRHGWPGWVIEHLWSECNVHGLEGGCTCVAMW